jgi:cellobiose dehydrogenase (acceptor)
MDGKRYLQEGFNVLTGGFQKAGWKSVVANDQPNEKNHTYAHTPYMYSGGERGGPMATYLVTASQRNNFDLWMNTAVKWVVREGGHATGIEVQAFRDGGYSGTVQLTPGTGRVILSAGTFGSAKILLRSGIGPKDQLQIVQQSDDAATMIKEDSWISLPVGYNLMDHLNVSFFYDCRIGKVI